MAAVGGLLLAENEERRRRQQLRLMNRNLRDTANPFEFTEVLFIRVFRLNKEAARYLINEVEPYMNVRTRQTAIPNHLKVLCALHFFGHGSYQLDVGYGGNFSLSQPSVSRCIFQVTEIINTHLMNRWIKFPYTIEQINNKKQMFLDKYNFPDTIGAIDGTHIAIITPPREHPIYPAAPYLNRKGFYSINVQIIVDAQLEIINMNARYPGSVHDAAIWMMSSISQHLRNRYINENISWHIIGDDGYPLSPWLMVQYPGNVDPQTPQGRFNQRLRSSRNCIELLNGKLKGRFRCTMKDRTLHYNPIKAAKIIYTCGVLHNICKYFRVPFPDEPLHVDDEMPPENPYNGEQNFYIQGQRKRNLLTEQFFNHH